MRKKVLKNQTEYQKVLLDFYRYFENGHEFEKFLKIYLEQIGLDEVVITKKSHDGGIDLNAIRNGIGEFGGDDIVKYVIQAKRYKPGRTVNITSVRALSGVLNRSEIGIFITTASFSKRTREEILHFDRKIILVDGEALINSCIENEIGFVYKPIFSKTALDEIMNKDIKDDVKVNSKEASINKDITQNDIRARILRLPHLILDKIGTDKKTIDVWIKGKSFSLSIDKGRKYLAGVTQIYRDNNLILDDGTYRPAEAHWTIDEDNRLYLDFIFKNR